ncbi:MAG: ParB/Srx family N-terminal domain-containing protein [Collinsella sp.]
MRKTELKIEEIPIDELVPLRKQRQEHTREQIDAVEASIKEFGFRNPVIVWRNADGRPEVVAGHARVTAAKNIGMQKVPCVSCDDLTDAQRRALTLVDNQTTMMTGWDFDTLNYELRHAVREFDMSDFGFDTTGAADIDNLFTEEGEPKDDSPARKTATCPNCGETFEL